MRQIISILLLLILLLVCFDRELYVNYTVYKIKNLSMDLDTTGEQISTTSNVVMQNNSVSTSVDQSISTTQGISSGVTNPSTTSIEIITGTCNGPGICTNKNNENDCNITPNCVWNSTFGGGTQGNGTQDGGTQGGTYGGTQDGIGQDNGTQGGGGGDTQYGIGQGNGTQYGGSGQGNDTQYGGSGQGNGTQGNDAAAAAAATAAAGGGGGGGVQCAMHVNETNCNQLSPSCWWDMNAPPSGICKNA